MFRSMAILSTLILTLFATSVSAKTSNHKCDGPTCTTCHPKKADHDCSGASCTTCHPKTDMKAQATCPVMGGAVDSTLFVDYNGERIYVCCKGCIATFKADPEMYLDKMKANGEKPAKIK